MGNEKGYPPNVQPAGQYEGLLLKTKDLASSEGPTSETGHD